MGLLALPPSRGRGLWAVGLVYDSAILVGMRLFPRARRTHAMDELEMCGPVARRTLTLCGLGQGGWRRPGALPTAQEPHCLWAHRGSPFPGFRFHRMQ